MLANSTATTVKDILYEAGLLVETVHFDGRIHRIPTIDRPTRKNGSYIAHADEPISIWWQNWRSGESGTWTAKRETTLTVTERNILNKRIEENKKTQKIEQMQRYAEASNKARVLYNAAIECITHHYLTVKGVNVRKGLKVRPHGDLIIPLYDEHNALVSLQYIDKEGNKRFLTGGKKKGCFFPIEIENINKHLLIVEGLATGLSLHECISHTVLVVFDAGNLFPVAALARRLYPECTSPLC